MLSRRMGPSSIGPSVVRSVSDMNNLKDDLLLLDEPTIKLVIVEAEKMLSAQLQFAEVMDKRAVTYATISAGIATASLSTVITLRDSLNAIAVGVFLGFFVAAFFATIVALRAFQPSKLSVPGFRPRTWRNIKLPPNGIRILCDIAVALDNRITSNAHENERRADAVSTALFLILISPLISALMALFGLVYSRVGL